MKKIICLLLGAVMVFCMTGWTTGKVWSPETYSAPEASDYPKSDYVITENENFELWWIASTCTVDLIEKATGNRWGIVPEDGEDGATADNPLGIVMTSSEAASSLVLEVLNASNYQRTFVRSNTSAVENGFVVAKELEDGSGISVNYYFEDVDIMVPLDYVLREDSVAITLDPKKIQEGDSFTVVAARIAPYFCSVPNDQDDAYLFMPSGSGALVDNETLSSAGTEYIAQVYGFDAVMSRENLITAEKEVRLPVFGAKNGNLASCAIIETATESAEIGVKSGSSVIKHSGIWAGYQLRSYSDNYRQTINNGKSREQVYAHSMSETAMTVGYYPLSGDNANYSGMADTYRNYLKKQGSLTTTADESELNLTFVGGVMVDQSFFGVPYRELVAATTLDEAKTIIGELSSKTGADMSAKLVGFGSSGVEYNSYGGGFNINKKLGTVKNLSSLADDCGKNNVDLYFDFDLVKLKNSSSGFSTFFDTAYSPVLKVAKAYKYNAASRSYETETGYNLLTRSLLKEGAEKLLKKTSSWNLPGVSLEALTSTAWSDYSTGTTEYYGKGKMAADVTEIIKMISNDGHKIAAYDANAYAAVAADIIYDVPTSSSLERIFITDVPFYQMVFKGHVSMSSSSVNLAANQTNQILKCVESGIGLGYTVIANYYNEFIDYNGYYFFGSLYSDIGDSIVSTYNSLKDYYSAINGAEIVSHTIFESGLRETVFDNGVKAYVNYTDDSLTTPSGATVEVGGYVWEK